MLQRDETLRILTAWNEAWNAHDLEAVMSLLDDDVVFENWTGAGVTGRENLRKAWAPWFANHGGFRFTTEDLFVDEKAQRVLFQWTLEWPSMEKGLQGKPERRRGVDVMHFRDGKIVRKYTYSKTTVEIGGNRVKLVPAFP